jgi:hypothetical protein
MTQVFAESLARLGPLVERGIVTLGEDRIAIASWARPYGRVVASAFDAYRGTETPRFSRAV